MENQVLWNPPKPHGLWNTVKQVCCHQMEKSSQNLIHIVIWSNRGFTRFSKWSNPVKFSKYSNKANTANEVIKPNSANKVVKANSANGAFKPNSANGVIKPNSENGVIKLNSANGVITNQAAWFKPHPFLDVSGLLKDEMSRRVWFWVRSHWKMWKRSKKELWCKRTLLQLLCGQTNQNYETESL